MEQITIQVTPEVKQKAEAILQEIGISVSSAYEMFYKQIIANQGMPFEVTIPNKTTINAMKQAREGKGKKYASVKEMFKDLED